MDTPKRNFNRQLVAIGVGLALASAVSMSAAAGAEAASVSYVGGDGNVWIASPDGSVKQKLTENGTTASPWRSPTQKNDGTVAAIKSAGGTAFVHFLRPSDGAQKDAWILPKSGAGSFASLFGGQVSPDGGMFAYDWRYFDCASFPCSSDQRVSFVSGPGITNPCLINCHGGWIKPRWIPGTPYAGMVSDHFELIGVQKAGSAGPVGWLASNPDVELIRSFDVGSNGRTLVETTPPGSDTSRLVLIQNNGTPPAGNPQAICTAEAFGVSPANPRWSPDGSMIAWRGAAGVYTSPAPTVSGATCNLAPKLIAPGATDPSWGLADAPKQDSGKPSGGGSGAKGKKCKKNKKKKKGKKRKRCKK